MFSNKKQKTINMNSRVFIIAGHQGRGTGASSKWLDEGMETITLRDLIALNLTKYEFYDFVLDNGVDPISDKSSLTTVTSWLKKNAKNTDISIDIHFNAATANVSGTEVFIPNNATVDERTLANRLLQVITTTLGTKSRGVKTESSSQHSKLAMLSSFDCLNLLLEICFCTNEGDCNKYYEKREILAENIAKEIINFLKEQKC